MKRLPTLRNVVRLAVASAAALAFVTPAGATITTLPLYSAAEQARLELQYSVSQLQSLHQQRQQIWAQRPVPPTAAWRSAFLNVQRAIASAGAQFRLSKAKLEAVRAKLAAFPAPDAELSSIAAGLARGEDVTAAWSAWVQKQAQAGQKDADALVDRLLATTGQIGMSESVRSARMLSLRHNVGDAWRAEYERAQTGQLPYTAKTYEEADKKAKENEDPQGEDEDEEIKEDSTKTLSTDMELLSHIQSVEVGLQTVGEGALAVIVYVLQGGLNRQHQVFTGTGPMISGISDTANAIFHDNPEE